MTAMHRFELKLLFDPICISLYGMKLHDLLQTQLSVNFYPSLLLLSHVHVQGGKVIDRILVISVVLCMCTQELNIYATLDRM